MKRIIVESPFMFRSEDPEDRAIGQLRNITYARLACHDSIRRGETPYGSHLLLTQPHILNDDDPVERDMGIQAGFEWGKAAQASAFYLDLGVSTGMRYGAEAANEAGRETFSRNLPGWEQALTESPRQTLLRLGLFSPEALDHYAAFAAMSGPFGPLPFSAEAEAEELKDEAAVPRP